VNSSTATLAQNRTRIVHKEPRACIPRRTSVRTRVRSCETHSSRVEREDVIVGGAVGKRQEPQQQHHPSRGQPVGAGGQGTRQRRRLTGGPPTSTRQRDPRGPGPNRVTGMEGHAHRDHRRLRAQTGPRAQQPHRPAQHPGSYSDEPAGRAGGGEARGGGRRLARQPSSQPLSPTGSRGNASIARMGWDGPRGDGNRPQAAARERITTLPTVGSDLENDAGLSASPPFADREAVTSRSVPVEHAYAWRWRWATDGR
jgi:hypothetical protein